MFRRNLCSLKSIAKEALVPEVKPKLILIGFPNIIGLMGMSRAPMIGLWTVTAIVAVFSLRRFLQVTVTL